MKSELIVTAIAAPLWLAATLSSVLAQPSLAPLRGEWPGWAAGSMGESTTTREYTNVSAGAAGGSPVAEVHRVTEIASGLNYQDGDGEWRPSLDLIELQAGGGAAALHAPNKMYFSGDLASDAAITFVTRSKVALKVHPLGIYYSDPPSGKTVTLASVNSSAVAELVPPNQIVYRRAFDSDAVLADLLLTFTKGGYASDVIFTRKPKGPDFFSIDPATAQIQVRHAWLNAPIPRTTTQVISPDLSDEALDFGDFSLAPGTAFRCDEQEPVAGGLPARIGPPSANAGSTVIRVGKHWETAGDLSVLTESVNWKDLQPELSKLPELAKRDSRTNELTVATAQPVPGLNSHKSVQIAAAPYRAVGVVVDYDVVVPVSGTLFKFWSDRTWFVSGPACFNNQVWFYQGAVIKFANNAGIFISGPSGAVTCFGTVDCPSILTSESEDIFGERLPWSTGSPTYCANPAIDLYNMASPQTLNGLQIRWAKIGLMDDQGGSVINTLQNSKLECCQTGAWINNVTMGFQNTTYCSAGPPLTGSGNWFYNGYPSSVCAPGQDSDSDGLPNDWMVKYFGHTTAQSSDYSRASDDADGDNVTNLQEKNAGTSPVDHTVWTATPPYQIVPQGTAVTFTAAATPAGVLYDWYNYIPGTEVENYISSGPSLTIPSAQAADSRVYKVYARPNNHQLQASWTTRLFVTDSFGWNVWNTHLATSIGKNINMWSVYALPPSWPTGSPTLAWDPTCLLYGKVGFTGVSSCNNFNTYMPVTAISRRHAYMRGHSNGAAGFSTEKAGGVVWFCPADNSPPVGMTIAATYLRIPPGPDYCVMIFSSDIPPSITPVMLGYTNPYNAVTYSTCQHGLMSANVPPFDFDRDSTFLASIGFNSHRTSINGDSGAPDLLPTPDGKLVLVHGRTTSSPGPQMQADMDYLSSYMSLTPDLYRPTWYPNVVFVGSDSTTQGNWKGVYGGQGENVIADSLVTPADEYLSAVGCITCTWGAAPTESRALLRAATGRIAACWYSPSSFDVNLIESDGQPYRVALYFLDWDTTGRSETVEVRDAATGLVIDSHTISSFHNGQYLVWDIAGSVTFHISRTAGLNAVLSGIFFGPASSF